MRTTSEGSPSGCPKETNGASAKRCSPPPAVPNQRSPAASSRSGKTGVPRIGPGATRHETDSPLIRQRPAAVAAQTFPSRSAASVWIFSLGRPSSLPNRRAFPAFVRWSPASEPAQRFPPRSRQRPRKRVLLAPGHGNGFDPAVRAVPEEARARGDPEGAVGVFEERGDLVAPEAVRRGEDLHDAVRQAHEPAAPRTGPESAVAVLQQAADGLLRDLLAGAERVGRALDEPREPRGRADPEASVPPPEERVDQVVREAGRVPPVVDRERRPVEPREPLLGAHPEEAVPGERKGEPGALGEPLRGAPGIVHVLGEGPFRVEGCRGRSEEKGAEDEERGRVTKAHRCRGAGACGEKPGTGAGPRGRHRTPGKNTRCLGSPGTAFGPRRNPRPDGSPARRDIVRRQ